MTYSLWRNGEHLGDVVLPLPTSGRHRSIAGVFVPTAAFHDLAPVMQVRPPILPGRPVFESPLTGPPHPGPIGLIPMAEDDAKGLAVDRILELRDADGAPLALQMLTLRRLPTPPNGYPNAVADACTAAHVPYSEWYLHAAHDVAFGAREV